MIHSKNVKNGNGSERKKIFDKSTLTRKSFELSNDVKPQDITNKHFSVQYFEEIKFEVSANKKVENDKENKENGEFQADPEKKPEVEIQSEPNEIEKNEI